MGWGRKESKARQRKGKERNEEKIYIKKKKRGGKIKGRSKIKTKGGDLLSF